MEINSILVTCFIAKSSATYFEHFDPAAAVANIDFIQESVPENLEIKQALLPGSMSLQHPMS